MPRGPRLDAPDALHHVIARGIERCVIFEHDGDRQEFLERLARSVEPTRTGLLAWCLMPNHFHLLLRTGRTPLSTVMRRVLAGYAVVFNRRHRRSGHLFQNRFKSILVEEDPYLLELVRYIHLNPVRAGLVASVDALARYPWTGHAVLLGQLPYPAQDTAPVLAQFGRTPRAARRAYQAFIRDGLAAPTARDLDGGGLRRSAGTWEVARARARRPRALALRRTRARQQRLRGARAGHRAGTSACTAPRRSAPRHCPALPAGRGPLSSRSARSLQPQRAPARGHSPYRRQLPRRPALWPDAHRHRSGPVRLQAKRAARRDGRRSGAGRRRLDGRRAALGIGRAAHREAARPRLPRQQPLQRFFSSYRCHRAASRYALTSLRPYDADAALELGTLGTTSPQILSVF